MDRAKEVVLPSTLIGQILHASGHYGVVKGRVPFFINGVGKCKISYQIWNGKGLAFLRSMGQEMSRVYE